MSPDTLFFVEILTTDEGKYTFYGEMDCNDWSAVMDRALGKFKEEHPHPFVEEIRIREIGCATKL